MKQEKLKLVRYVLVGAIILLSYHSFSQAPPPPGGSSGTGNVDDNRNGGRAPLGSGLLLLIGLGGIYGGYSQTKTSLLNKE